VGSYPAPSAEMREIRGITFDFYQTLVRHGTGEGRVVALAKYLAERGLAGRPFEHGTLYELFEVHHRGLARHGHWVEITRWLFTHLELEGPSCDRPELHADAVRELLGPASLHVFEDALPALEEIRRRGYSTGIVSNWQCGLESFCEELGLRRHVDFVISSAEVGCAKPERRIFELALDALGLPAAAVAHVGDHPEEDAAGAREVGMLPILLVREGEAVAREFPVLLDLTGVPRVLDELR